MAARRPVPTGCVGARRERVYWPARLWLEVVPAMLPDEGGPRNFISASLSVVSNGQAQIGASTGRWTFNVQPVAGQVQTSVDYDGITTF